MTPFREGGPTPEEMGINPDGKRDSEEPKQGEVQKESSEGTTAETEYSELAQRAIDAALRAEGIEKAVKQSGPHPREEESMPKFEIELVRLEIAKGAQADPEKLLKLATNLEARCDRYGYDSGKRKFSEGPETSWEEDQIDLEYPELKDVGKMNLSETAKRAIDIALRAEGGSTILEKKKVPGYGLFDIARKTLIGRALNLSENPDQEEVVKNAIREFEDFCNQNNLDSGRRKFAGKKE